MVQAVANSRAVEHPSVDPYPREIRPHTTLIGVEAKIAREQARARYGDPESLRTGQTSELPPSSTATSDIDRAADQRQAEPGQGVAQVYGLWSDLARRLETLITATESNGQSLHEQPPSYDGASRG